MNYNKSRIQVIGSYLEQVIQVLDSMGIFTENIINNCSPLAMTGTFDKTYQKYSDMADLKPHELLNIRKNLDKALSRDPNDFSDNFNIQPYGKETRSCNTSEYLLCMNSCIQLTVLEKSDMVYSEYTIAEIKNAIKNSEGGCTRRTFPFSGSFNWKYYYDRFIDAILNEYDPEHIIFIRSNCSRFYMEEKDIKAYDSTLSDQFIGAMEQMDNYFIEKTHCLVIDEHLNNIPTRYIGCLFPCIQMGVRSVRAIAEDVYDIIVNKNAAAYKKHFYGYTSDFSKTLLSRLSKDIIAQNSERIKYIDDNMLNLDKLSKIQQGSCEFFDNILKLKQFLDIENKYRLAEYAVDVQNKKIAADIELIELYTRYFKLDLNDIIAVYLLCNDCEYAAEYKKIVFNILSNSDCISVDYARKFKEKNIDFLKEYPYISVKEFDEDNVGLYVPLDNNAWLVLNPNYETPIRKFVFNVCKEFDYNKVISDGYICSIEDADALTYSFDYYIEKARCGDGTKPTFLKFETQREFLDSLYYIDYPSLLENERFVFDINNVVPFFENFIPIADFTDFIDPNTVYVRIGEGLGDQIGRYVLGKIFQSISGRKVLYDDCCIHFNGMEVTKFAKQKMDLVNERLSPRLRGGRFIDNIGLKISPDFVYITHNIRIHETATTIVMRYHVTQLLNLRLPYLYIDVMYHPEAIITSYTFNIRDYIEFPPLEKDEHIRLKNEMLDCDAVVIHVRRGDYVRLYQERDKLYFNYDRYIEAINKLLAIPDYPNKKYFVFSDDIKWCRDNKSMLGLDLIGDSEIRFIEGNKYEESFRDIQLMSYGKIMVGGGSGFFNLASLYSDRCEVYLGAKDFMRSFMGNKYDVGRFKEKFLIDINEKKAKEELKTDSKNKPLSPKK